MITAPIPSAAKLASMACACEQRGQLGKAEQLYRRALARVRRRPGTLETAALLNNLAALYQARGEATRAEHLYRRALRIKESLLGPESERLAFTLNNLAVFYRTMGWFGDARSSYERALGIFRKTLGAAHPHVAAVLANLAQLLRAEAQAIEKRAASIEQDLKEVSDREQWPKAAIDLRCGRFRLTVRPSKIHRFGLFAEEAIPAGSDIIEYTGERVGRQKAVRRWNSNRTYLLKLNSYWRLDGSVDGSGAQFINHCCEPNVRFRAGGEAVWCQAVRYIQPAEELTVDYKFPSGSELIPCYCGAPGCRGTINERPRVPRTVAVR